MRLLLLECSTGDQEHIKETLHNNLGGKEKRDATYKAEYTPIDMTVHAPPMANVSHRTITRQPFCVRARVEQLVKVLSVFISFI